MKQTACYACDEVWKRAHFGGTGEQGRWSRRGRSPERSQGSSTEWRAGEDEQEMKRTQASKGAAGGRGCARCDRTVGLLAGSGDFCAWREEGLEWTGLAAHDASDMRLGRGIAYTSGT
ncbi:hypothetical protein H109_07226 [Trichophyton interdigitale MR816]|uniref:Uncharacterized protein n=1 Tax=Trichophyton interdigitale (strain MR816) TaxID=1215338 RepID=A0A059IZ62_TRIIM|nr:hypothetical protein H109_07226 [Trichophyton interdigitale MR816]